MRMMGKGVSRTTLAVLLLALAGCGGGGGGSMMSGGGGGGGLPDPDPLAPEQPATDFSSSAEFAPCFSAGPDTFCVYGLGQIGAQHAYALGSYGSGVVVAVVDTGIDTTHSELDANISAQSIDIANGLPMTDDNGHGTHVAGIIAAEKNDTGMHGVAFEATILAIRVDDADTGVMLTSDITAGINYAAGKAHVINLSLGAPGTTIDNSLGPDFEQSLINAMAEGAIIVAAAGNEGAAEPTLPAAYAGNTTVNAAGQMIAVGAVDDTGAQATFSNYCGSAKDFCLVAPGVDIVSTYPGGLAVGSGTSQAAPHVAGAAALLVQLWPTLAPDAVVQILLTTATDLGVAGVDSVFGHGLLNVQAAVAPVGDLIVPLTDSVSGGSVALNGTALALGSAFGDAMSGSALLAQAFAIDDYERNYLVGLDRHVMSAERGFALAAMLGDSPVETVTSELGDGLRLSLGVTDPDDAASPADISGLAADANDAPVLHGMSLAVRGGADTDLRIGYGVTPEQQTPGLSASAPAALFWMPGDTLGPQHALVGAGNGLALSRRLGSDTSMTLGWVEQDDSPAVGTRDSRIGEMLLAHRFADRAVAYASVAAVQEDGGFLASDAGGGFAVKGADTRFLTLGGRYALGGGMEVIGSYTLGATEMTAAGAGLLGDWSDLRVDAFGLGLVRTGFLGARDRIGLLAGQPLRVAAGAATLTAPVDYLVDKTVVQDSERVSMVPSGREIDLQLAYDRPLSGSAALSGWLMMQFEPGHVAAADPAYGGGIRFDVDF